MDELLPQKQLPEWQKTWVYQFLTHNLAWTFNMVMTNILFWAIAFPLLLEHGYSDSHQTDKGAIPSGPSGRGVGPILIMLEFIVTVIYVNAMVSCCCCGCCRRPLKCLLRCSERPFACSADWSG